MHWGPAGARTQPPRMSSPASGRRHSSGKFDFEAHAAVPEVTIKLPWAGLGPPQKTKTEEDGEDTSSFSAPSTSSRVSTVDPSLGSSPVCMTPKRCLSAESSASSRRLQSALPRDLSPAGGATVMYSEATFNELNSQILLLEARVHKDAGRIEMLQAELDSKTAEIFVKEATIRVKDTELAASERALASKDLLMESLQADLEDARSSIEQMQLEIDCLNGSVDFYKAAEWSLQTDATSTPAAISVAPGRTLLHSSMHFDPRKSGSAPNHSLGIQTDGPPWISDAHAEVLRLTELVSELSACPIKPYSRPQNGTCEPCPQCGYLGDAHQRISESSVIPSSCATSSPEQAFQRAKSGAGSGGKGNAHAFARTPSSEFRDSCPYTPVPSDDLRDWLEGGADYRSLAAGQASGTGAPQTPREAQSPGDEKTERTSPQAAHMDRDPRYDRFQMLSPTHSGANSVLKGSRRRGFSGARVSPISSAVRSSRQNHSARRGDKTLSEAPTLELLQAALASLLQQEEELKHDEDADSDSACSVSAKQDDWRWESCDPVCREGSGEMSSSACCWSRASSSSCLDGPRRRRMVVTSRAQAHDSSLDSHLERRAGKEEGLNFDAASKHTSPRSVAPSHENVKRQGCRSPAEAIAVLSPREHEMLARWKSGWKKTGMLQAKGLSRSMSDSDLAQSGCKSNTNNAYFHDKCSAPSDSPRARVTNPRGSLSKLFKEKRASIRTYIPGTLQRSNSESDLSAAQSCRANKTHAISFDDRRSAAARMRAGRKEAPARPTLAARVMMKQSRSLQDLYDDNYSTAGSDSPRVSPEQVKTPRQSLSKSFRANRGSNRMSTSPKNSRKRSPLASLVTQVEEYNNQYEVE